MLDALSGLAADFGAAPVIFAFVVMFVAGFTKGAVGFALPMIAVSGIGSALSAQVAVAAVILPTVASNVWQAFRFGPRAFWESLREFRLLCLVLFPCIAIFAQLATVVSDRTLFTVLGGGVTAFGLVMILGWKPPSPDRAPVPAAVATGLVAGFFGGLSGVWGPPILLYLIARGTPKREIMQAQGTLYFLGSLVLLAAHLRSGLLLGPGGALSVWMLIPAAAGMAAGIAAHDRLDQDTFRKMTLAVLVLAGLNLLRRGLF